MPEMSNLKLTPKELQALYNLLLEEAQRMDDDGREGSFERSPLSSIWKKIQPKR